MKTEAVSSGSCETESPTIIRIAGKETVNRFPRNRLEEMEGEEVNLMVEHLFIWGHVVVIVSIICGVCELTNEPQ